MEATAAAAVAAALPAFPGRSAAAGRPPCGQPAVRRSRAPRKGKGEKGSVPHLGALGPEPHSGLRKDKHVPDIIDTPLDPRPCKNTPSKSQCLCLGLGIVWVRGVAVDLLFK